MGKNAASILQDAKSLLEHGDWIGGPGNQASEAVDETGQVVKAESRKACKWTLYGAILAVSPSIGDDRIEAASWLKLEIRTQYKLPSLFDYNTQIAITRDDVLQLIDRALVRAQTRHHVGHA